MNKHTIRLYPLGKEIHVNHDTPLIDVLHEFGVEFPCGGKGSCGKCRIRLLEGDINEECDQIRKAFRPTLTPDQRLACQSKCTGDITLEIEQFNHIILADESEFDFVPDEGYGIAVDLGTTTVVTQLVDLSDARVIDAGTMLNPQLRFGSDLISRIQAGLDGHASDMMWLIRRAIGDLISGMLKKHPVPVTRIVIVGNTVMHHLFKGADVSPLASFPFQPDDTGLSIYSPAGLGWKFGVKESIRFFPSIGSFVGSDILAGIAATGLHKSSGYTALIDLGTNGEIVIGNKDRIVCASTAAGPAFEGTNISMGMRAVTGAISSVSLLNGKMKATVIGNSLPKGICGSGLIDAMAVLRKTGKIGDFGEIVSGVDRIQLAGKVFLTQKDIQEFLLAKAALAGGLTILAGQLSVQPEEIEKVYIAGGFGNYINVTHMRETGMIRVQEEKIHKMGNTALIGAKMFLFSHQASTGEILQKTTHISLERDPAFQDIFVGNMLFEQPPDVSVPFRER